MREIESELGPLVCVFYTHLTATRYRIKNMRIALKACISLMYNFSYIADYYTRSVLILKVSVCNFANFGSQNMYGKMSESP